jgi:hypothetical protein
MKRPESDTVQLKVRMKEPLRAQLEKAAAKRGVSLNTEATDRLQQTFLNQKVLQEALDLSFGTQISELLIIIGDVMRSTAQTVTFAARGDPSLEIWSEDPLVFDKVVQAVEAVLNERRPTGKIMPISKEDAAKRINADNIAQEIAIKRINELTRSKGTHQRKIQKDRSK